jgi:hypothetical protein
LMLMIKNWVVWYIRFNEPFAMQSVALSDQLRW